MIISDKVIKTQKNFWNGCLFHPTDAIEDPWGKRILDAMAEDGAIKTVRIYTMFEDIVYIDGNGKLAYDFRLSDLRLDYLLEKGYELLLAYAGIPDCIAACCDNKTSVSKNKTRYKGKMWNSAPPKDYALWEEICYEYTLHNVERYGIDVVSGWYCQCFNEADISLFFMSELPDSETGKRSEAYCKLYEAFVKGVGRASEKIRVGGPALALNTRFLGDFLDNVKRKNLRLDFISLHNYGVSPYELNAGTGKICVDNHLKKHREKLDVMRACGFENTPVLLDEWGASSHGFFNKDECPALMFRETEVFAAYYVKLICAFINSGYNIERMLICLSGQHEMTEDFSGFRNFYTLNFIKKPIYNAYILASKLGEGILKVESKNKDVSVIPTKTSSGDYAVLLTYASENFNEDLPDTEEEIIFKEDISEKTITVWLIDKTHTDPYRLYERLGIKTPEKEQIKLLRDEGNMKPALKQSGAKKLKLKLTANATALIAVTAEKA